MHWRRFARFARRRGRLFGMTGLLPRRRPIGSRSAIRSVTGDLGLCSRAASRRSASSSMSIRSGLATGTSRVRRFCANPWPPTRRLEHNHGRQSAKAQWQATQATQQEDDLYAVLRPIEVLELQREQRNLGHQQQAGQEHEEEEEDGVELQRHEEGVLSYGQ